MLHGARYPASVAGTVSIVIPILNEADELPELLASLRPFASQAEIVFVDGRSADASATLVRAAGHRLISGAPGWARQMNAGARATHGDVLLFLHADARLPADAVLAVRTAMADPGVVAGRFDLTYETRVWPYPWIAWFGNQRSRITKIFTGDQTIFVRRSAFIAVGRFPDIPLMETSFVAPGLSGSPSARSARCSSSQTSGSAHAPRFGWSRRPT